MNSRKGFLRKVVSCVMAMALCAGVFMAMPLTAKAADQADILGTWKCGYGEFTFTENTSYHKYPYGGSDESSYEIVTGSTIEVIEQGGSKKQ